VEQPPQPDRGQPLQPRRATSPSINSPDNQLRATASTTAATALHVIFSPRLLAENNQLQHTGTGIVVLYSPGGAARQPRGARPDRRRRRHRVQGKRRRLIEGNQVLHCSVGLKLDAPPESVAARG
jgi:hypothetical protein